ncbi:MAG: hypothetical protein RMJ83_07420 [Armatimonadota bacterium]|nr:hypothetical protein [Armatimonadota bacterium]
MSRIGWIVGILLLVLIGVAVWVVQDERLGIETRPPDHFAQMSRAEQAEWLAKQVLARASRHDWWAQLERRLLRQRDPHWDPLTIDEVKAVGAAGVAYERPWLIRHAQRRVADCEGRYWLSIYLMELYAKRGKVQAIWREARQITHKDRRAFALASAGARLWQQGNHAEAQRCFAAAIDLLKQSQHLRESDGYCGALQVLARYSPGYEDSFVLSELLYDYESLRDVAEEWLAQGNHMPLRTLVQLTQKQPTHYSLVVRALLAIGLIEAGKLEEGYRILPNRIPAVDAIRLARALYRQKRTAQARAVLNAVQRITALEVGIHPEPRLLRVLESALLSLRDPVVSYQNVPYRMPRVRTKRARIIVPAYDGSVAVRGFPKPLTVFSDDWVDQKVAHYVDTAVTLDMRRKQFYPACREMGACDALEALTKQASDVARIQLHLEAAACYHQAGQQAKAQEQIAAAIRALNGISYSDSLVQGIRSLHQVGAHALADQFLQGATRWVERIPSGERISAIRLLAFAYAANGDYVQAIRAALALPSPYLQRDALAGILEEMLRHEQAR